MTDRESLQVLRSMYDQPEDERFYARAFGIMSRPGRALRTATRIGNLIYYGLLLFAAGFAVEQVLDRREPVTMIAMAADPPQVQAGHPVRVRVEVDRHQRCDVAIEWTVVDSATEVHHYGPKAMRAPGPPGHDEYVVPYDVGSMLPSGPATLSVTLRAACPGSYIERWWPVVMDLPPVAFEVLPPPHDKSPDPH